MKAREVLEKWDAGELARGEAEHMLAETDDWREALAERSDLLEAVTAIAGAAGPRIRIGPEGPRSVTIDGRQMAEYPLDCPECGAKMELRKDSYGIRYLCTAAGCCGSHGAHPDGKPVGTPANRAIRRARSNAHETFDRLWKSGRMARSQAYAWMEKALELEGGRGHISMFDLRTCRRLEDLCVRDFPDLFPFRAND